MEGNMVTTRFTVTACAAVFGATLAYGNATVWLNWANSDATLDSCWAAGGYGAGQGLTATERTQIRDGVQAQMGLIYTGFLTTFTSQQPGAGNYHRLTYGATTTTSGL